VKPILIMLFAACWLSAAQAQDHRHVAPLAGGGVMFENDAVQVVRITIAPHQRTPMHDVTPRVVIWLGEAHFIDHFPNGESTEERRHAGEAEWVPARRHSGENLGDTPMEFIAVIMKERGGASVPADGRRE
jgi:quercetin dioxygenase-like cupin family protein